MILYRVLIVLAAYSSCFDAIPRAAEPRAAPYSLSEILALALKHSPVINGAEAVLEESHGRQVSAGAYMNPTVSGSAGRGSIRDPRTGVSITERTISVEQPLEWPGKRMARQRAADAGLSGASPEGRNQSGDRGRGQSGVPSTPLCSAGCAVGQRESSDRRGFHQTHSGEGRDQGVAEIRAGQSDRGTPKGR